MFTAEPLLVLCAVGMFSSLSSAVGTGLNDRPVDDDDSDARSANVNPLFLASRPGSGGGVAGVDDLGNNVLAVLRREELPDADTWALVRARLSEVMEECKTMRMELQVGTHGNVPHVSATTTVWCDGTTDC